MTVVRDVAARVQALPRGSRIAVDGVSASGKTTFADALVGELGDGVARLSLDDFLAPPPRAVYYPDAFDFARFRAAVEPIGETVVVDGLFLLHPALREIWDFSVFLRCDHRVAIERGIARDSSWMENARERYETRYGPEERRYVEEVDPEALADVVVDTTDLDRPRLVRERT